MAESLERLGARRYWAIWTAVIPLGLWALVRLLGLEVGYPLVPLLAYTPYVALAALFLTGIALAWRNWAAAALAGVATACLVAVVVPRAVGGETVDATGQRQLTVLSANIHHGTADAEALVALVERFRPDLLSVQELTPRFARELQAAGVDRLLPIASLAVRRDVSGAGIYSRLPLRRLSEAPGLRFRMPRVSVALPGGGTLRVVGVHPYPPLAKRVDEWGEALESLPSAGRGAPWLLIGDFNATLDHNELREVLDRGYRDAGDATGKGLEPTWPARIYRSPPVTIDHVLADRRIGIVDYEVEDIAGSDHRAVFARLALP